MAETKQQHGRLYGRRQTHRLGKARQDALDALLPKLGIEIAPALDPKNLFKEPKKQYWLEIGFGSGEHLAALMARHPENGYIGAEPFINGMAAFLKELSSLLCHPRESGDLIDVKQPDSCVRRNDTDLSNIRVLMDDAIILCENLVDGCLDGIYVLNPDPWPKTRHHKRRIISKANLDIFARILKPGGKLIMATDVDDLAEWMVTQAFNHPAFEWTANSSKDWQTPPPEWIETRYASKGKQAGRRQTFLIFRNRG